MAQAFGAAVRALRLERGIAQETLANLAGIERSHTGKIERGEHMPTLAIIFKIASALECSTAVLMTATEGQLAATGT
ncbi:helix-turn-helix domain-containing protein [Pseudomonas aeruginosa]|uniref:helix-turn-helix domain-containing protein n=1 Tax=Pseudomonas aeruginosa TaxID=287 RepID=UPI003F7F0A20